MSLMKYDFLTIYQLHWEFPRVATTLGNHRLYYPLTYFLPMRGDYDISLVFTRYRRTNIFQSGEQRRGTLRICL